MYLCMYIMQRYSSSRQTDWLATERWPHYNLFFPHSIFFSLSLSLCGRHLFELLVTVGTKHQNGSEKRVLVLLQSGGHINNHFFNSHISHCFISHSLCVCVERKWKLTQLPSGFCSVWFRLSVYSWQCAMSPTIGRHLSLMGRGEFSFLAQYTTPGAPPRYIYIFFPTFI